MVYRALSMELRAFATPSRLSGPDQQERHLLSFYVHLPDGSAATEAAELIARFGEQAAADEAAARADRSREVGNVLHFCRWRQIERLILLLAAGRGIHTIH